MRLPSPDYFRAGSWEKALRLYENCFRALFCGVIVVSCPRTTTPLESHRIWENTRWKKDKRKAENKGERAHLEAFDVHLVRRFPQFGEEAADASSRAPAGRPRGAAHFVIRVPSACLRF